MSEAAEMLLEEKIVDILERLCPDTAFEEYLHIENKVFSEIFGNDNGRVFISKLDDHAHNLALMALDLMSDLDISKIERKEDGEREKE